MKKLSLSVALLLITLISLSAFATQPPAVERQKALNVLLRTNRVIGVAHMSVKRGKVYTGNLAKAVRHERYAKKLFNQGNYHRAIVHSRKARLFAVEAIKANKVKPTSDCTITPEEGQLAGTAPSDQELEDEMAKEEPEVKEEDLVNNNNLGLEVK